jgi:hypothetical protein
MSAHTCSDRLRVGCLLDRQGDRCVSQIMEPEPVWN